MTIKQTVFQSWKAMVGECALKHARTNSLYI